MEKVTLVRPDGSTFEANREDVEQYRALGYEPETAEETVSRNIETAREEFFTAPGQRTVAGLEGFLNGLTLGGYTTLLGGSEDEQDRARYNPGTRLGGEIVGAVLPALVPGGGVGSALRATPSGLLARGAEGAASALTKTKTGHALVRGVAEGAVMGAGAEATNAKLAGDPVTAEALVAGMGWGALWGGGLGYVAGKFSVTAEKMAADAAAKTARETIEYAIPAEAWGAFRSTIDDVNKTTLKVIDDATAAIDSRGIPRSKGFADDTVSTVRARDIEARGFNQPPGVGTDKVKMDKARRAIAEGQKEPIVIAVDSRGQLEVVDGRHRLAAAIEADAPITVKWSHGVDVDDTLIQRVLEYADKMEEAQGALFNRIDIKGLGRKRGAPGFKKELRSLQRQITRAVNDRNYAAFEQLAKRHATVMKALGDLTKQAVPELEPFVLKAAAEGAKALDDLKGLRAVAEALDRFPFTVEGFMRMTPTKMEKVAAAAEKFIKDAPEELLGQKNALSQAIDDLVAAAGLQLDSATPGQKLRNAYEALRNSKTKTASTTAEKIKAGGFGHSTAKYVGGRAAAKFARGGGAGIVGSSLAFEAGSRLVGGLLRLKNGVLGTVVGSVQKWAPAAAKGAQRVAKAAPKIDPLMVRLDGSLEQKELPRKKLMEMRMKEIREAAPTINDTIYRAVEPLAAHNLALASQMNKAAVAQFQALVSRMPRDPGLAFSRMKSLWQPDAIMIEQFARAYEVFQNPIGVVARWLQNPRSITPEGARALKEMNPELWQLVRVEMLNRLAEPGVLDQLKYHEQVGLGLLLDIRIHSTQDPRFIQAQQLMFQQRKEPLPARPSVTNNSNNPSGVSRGLTAAQRITEH